MTMTTDGDSRTQQLPWSWTGLFELVGATQAIVKERKWVNQHSRHVRAKSSAQSPGTDKVLRYQWP